MDKPFGTLNERSSCHTAIKGLFGLSAEWGALPEGSWMASKVISKKFPQTDSQILVEKGVSNFRIIWKVH